jgi:hypothetical protein
MNKVTTTRRPTAVALANKFIWELLLTNKWDHIFLGDENIGLSVFPREISFCPTKDVWTDGSQVEGDSKLISYFEYSIGSCVIVGMRKEFVGSVELWYPNSVLLEMRLLTQDLILRHGSNLVATPPLKVWHKE